jgi:hypothetical protein
MNASRYLALILGSTLAFQACAQESLVGEYTGTLSSVGGYGVSVGDPCAVLVGKSDMYGGSLVFQIRDVEKIMMETRHVEKALQQKSDIVKIRTPGSSGKPGETIIMKLRADGTMQSLKLDLFWNQEHREKWVTCSDLLKK